MRNSQIRFTFAFAMIAASFVVDAAAQISFTDVTTTSGIKYGTHIGRSWDVTFGDLDGNGTNELYCMGHYQGRNQKSSILYRSNSSLALTNITGTAFGGITATGGGQGCLFVDLDADGDLDLITGSNDGVGCVLENNGNAVFDWYSDFPGNYGSLKAREFTAGDIDGDGDLDIVMGTHDQRMRKATNNGSGVFTLADLPHSGSIHSCGATLPIMVDIDNDGDLDVISQFMSAFRKPSHCSPNRPITVDLWLNNGSGTVTWVSDTHGLTNGEEEGTLSVADFDNDGDLDIIQIVYRTLGVNGNNRFYINDGTGHFTEESASRGIADNAPFTDWWCKASVGDFDNDGDLDLHYRDQFWNNDGTGHFTISNYSGINGRISGTADLDGDGDLDLSGARVTNEQGFWLWKNNANNNSWLMVRTDDGPLNRYGIGAKVYVYDGSTLLGYRQVTSASAMQQTLDQHFGLGSVGSVRVEVLFPDGTWEIRNNVTAGQKIIVTKNGGNPIPPSTPSGVVTTGTDLGCADVSWNTPAPIQSVTEYMLAWGPQSGGFTDSVLVSVGDINSAGGTSIYRHCGLAAGSYCFKLRAHNAYDLWSAYSGVACTSVTTDSTSLVPGRPTGLSVANPDNGCADLSWDGPAPSDAVSEYVLAWGPSSGNYTDSIVVDVDNINTQGSRWAYSYCGLDAGTYCFKLRAHNTYDLWSAYSTEACTDITIGSPQPPPPPTGLSLSEPDFGQAAATWNAVGDPQVTGYMLYYGSSSVAGGQASAYDDSVDASTNTGATVGGLPGGTYYFSVRAYTATGERSGYAAEANLTMIGVDVAGPTISSPTPAEGATNVATNAPIQFTVSDDKTGVDESTVTLTVDGTTVTNLTILGSPSEYIVTATPASNYPDASTVQVEVSASDLASNPKTFSWTFTTASAPITDTEAPSFASEEPAEGATDVAADAEIRVRVTDAGFGVDAGSIAFEVNGLPINYERTGGSSDMTLVYRNTSGFTPGSIVNVWVEVFDLASPRNRAEKSFSFTVENAGGSGVPGAAAGQIVPDGYWANDPARPLEVKDLPDGWAVRIFDTSGIKVREYRNTNAAGQTWTWDFTNDSGKRVARALYLVRVTSSDGKVQHSGRFLVQRD